MAELITAVPGTRILIGPDWELRADRVDDLGDGGWSAVVGIRRGLKLLLTRNASAVEVDVEAWAGEPGDSDGVAVIDAGDGDLRLARVPLCACGDRGCGNAGVQFGKPLAPGDLPALVGLLRELPWASVVPARSSVLRGDGLAAIRDPSTNVPGAGPSYLRVAPRHGGRRSEQR
jgi:hypothetical protein